MDHPSAWSTLLPAIFGLVGVIIGGLITSGTSYWLETHKEKREREKESRIRAATLRQAARLVDEEFFIALSLIQFLVEQKKWAGVSDLKSTIATWEEHKKSLAMELSTSVWVEALKAHMSVKQLIELRAINIGSDAPAEPINTVLKLAELFRKRIEQGRAALVPLISSEPSEK